MTRAQETLQAARLLFECGHLNESVSRLYYACFYAVSSLLWTEGFSSSKHTGVRSLFARHWVKSGRLPAEMGRFYHRLFDFRHQADYDRVVFNRGDVEAWFHEAEAFVTEIARQIEKTVGAEEGQ